MRLIATPLAALLAALAWAVPAMADDGTPIGGPQVVTDPSTEVEPAPDADAPDPPDAPSATDSYVTGHRRGEPRTASSSHPAPSTPAPTPSPAAVNAPATGATGASEPSARAQRATRRRGTLPFTGVNAGALALIGLALLGSGLAARRQLV